MNRRHQSFSAGAVEQVVASKLDLMFDRFGDVVRTWLREMGPTTDKPASEVWESARKKQRHEHIKQAEKRHKDFEGVIERVQQRIEKEQAKHGQRDES